LTGPIDRDLSVVDQRSEPIFFPSSRGHTSLPFVVGRAGKARTGPKPPSGRAPASRAPTHASTHGLDRAGAPKGKAPRLGREQRDNGHGEREPVSRPGPVAG
jgi:hypothetical protein